MTRKWVKKDEKNQTSHLKKNQDGRFGFMTNKISITNDTISADQLQAYKKKN